MILLWHLFISKMNLSFPTIFIAMDIQVCEGLRVCVCVFSHWPDPTVVCCSYQPLTELIWHKERKKWVGLPQSQIILAHSLWKTELFSVVMSAASWHHPLCHRQSDNKKAYRVQNIVIYTGDSSTCHRRFKLIDNMQYKMITIVPWHELSLSGEMQGCRKSLFHRLPWCAPKSFWQCSPTFLYSADYETFFQTAPGETRDPLWQNPPWKARCDTAPATAIPGMLAYFFESHVIGPRVS